ncbi:hypothetical protein LINPERPRIM_LOCUS3285 [Linum perenne]
MVIGIVGIFGKLLGRGGRGRGRVGFGRGGRGRIGFARGGRGRIGFGRGGMLGRGGNTCKGRGGNLGKFPGKGRGGNPGKFGSWRSLRAAIADSMLENETAMKRDKKMHKGLEAAMVMLLSLLLS